MEKVLAIGNALVDILVRLKDDMILYEFGLAKGSMQLADMQLVNDIQNRTKDLARHQASGGSSANTIHGLAKLGVKTGYIGKVGRDPMASFFQKDMTDAGITTLLSLSSTPTGRAVALVTPDSERTFATYLGAAVELIANDITPDLFTGYSIFHVEGYLVQNHELLLKSVRLAKEAGVKISIDMASFNVVMANKEFLRTIVKDYVDIVFANEEEAKMFTGVSPEESVDEIAKMCDIAVVKLGKEGSLIRQKDKLYKAGSIKVNAIDTTGAGDLYASGFIYGLLNNMPLDKCAAMGAILGGNVIEVVGAKMDDTRWIHAIEEIKKIR